MAEEKNDEMVDSTDPCRFENEQAFKDYKEHYARREKEIEKFRVVDIWKQNEQGEAIPFAEDRYKRPVHCYLVSMGESDVPAFVFKQGNFAHHCSLCYCRQASCYHVEAVLTRTCGLGMAQPEAERFPVDEADVALMMDISRKGFMHFTAPKLFHLWQVYSRVVDNTMMSETTPELRISELVEKKGRDIYEKRIKLLEEAAKDKSSMAQHMTKVIGECAPMQEDIFFIMFVASKQGLQGFGATMIHLAQNLALNVNMYTHMLMNFKMSMDTHIGLHRELNAALDGIAKQFHERTANRTEEEKELIRQEARKNVWQVIQKKRKSEEEDPLEQLQKVPKADPEVTGQEEDQMCE